MKAMYSVIGITLNSSRLIRFIALSQLNKLLLFIACISPIVAIAQPVVAPRLTVTGIEVDGKSVSSADGFNFAASASTKAGDSSKPLSVNDPFISPMQTPAKTSVALRSLNGNTIRLEADSRLALGTVHRAGERYSLIAGAAEFDISAPLGFFQIDNDKIQLRTRNAKFRVQRLDSNKWEITVLRGVISVQRDDEILIADSKLKLAIPMAEILVADTKRMFETATPTQRQFATTTEAIDYYKNRVDAATASKDDDRIADAFRAQAELLSGVGKYQEAILVLQAWQAVARGNNIAQYVASIKIAAAFTALKEDIRTIGYLHQALKNASGPYSGGTSRDIYKMLSETYARLNDEPSKNRYANMFAGMQSNPSAAASYKAPTMTNRGDTRFPLAMRYWGLSGGVLIQTVVTTDGTQIETMVLKSAHPAFELAAIRGMMSTRSAPAIIDGKPVSMLIQVPFSFKLTPVTARSRMESGAFYFPKVNSSKPEESQYDVAPEIRLVSLPAYPRALLLDKVTGSATVSVTLDQLGSVQEVNIVAATHPDFGAATKAMMQNWDMAPALKNGQPVGVKFNYEHKFEFSERDNGLNEETWGALKRLRVNPSEIHELSTLDASPKALYQPAAADPRKSYPVANKIDTVQIEFIIDREGSVQFPRIVSATNMELAWSVATVLPRWLFEIPKIKGDAVFARKEMLFEFR